MATGDHPLTDEEVQSLLAELEEVKATTQEWEQHHARWRVFWTLVYNTLGIFSVIAAGAAGISGLAADNAKLAGWLGGVGALLTAVVAFTRADKKRVAHNNAVDSYETVLTADWANLQSDVKGHYVTDTAAHEGIKTLRKTITEIRTSTSRELGV